MARKIVNFTVTGEGRDKGKLFLLTEMTASKGEAWATRVLLALMASNVNLPENFADLGMAALAELGIRALSGLKWDVAAPLLAEMFDCIEIIPDPKKTHIHRPLIEEDVEEIQTRVILRMEVWKLHMGFLMAVIPSLEGTVKRAAGKK
jgi:hypothetical protein